MRTDSGNINLERLRSAFVGYRMANSHNEAFSDARDGCPLYCLHLNASISVGRDTIDHLSMDPSCLESSIPTLLLAALERTQESGGTHEGDVSALTKGKGKGKGPPFYGACSICNTVGHKTADCPTTGNGFKGTCYTCDLPGHFSRTCPFKGNWHDERTGS